MAFRRVPRKAPPPVAETSTTVPVDRSIEKPTHETADRPTLARASRLGHRPTSFSVRRAPSSDPHALPDGFRQRMEHAFDSDFSDVRLLRDSSTATDIGAAAFTDGADVHVAPGQPRPSSPDGELLVAHELAHVVQQREGRVATTDRLGGRAVNTDLRLEREADTVARRAVRGEAATSGRSTTRGRTVRRSPGVIQGFWPELILEGLLASAGLAAVATGTLTAATAGAGFVVGSAIVLGGSYLLSGSRGPQGPRGPQPQFHITNRNRAKDYVADYDDLKEMIGTGDPHIVFDDTRREIDIFYNYFQLGEQYPKAVELIWDMTNVSGGGMQTAIEATFLTASARRAEQQKKDSLLRESERRSTESDVRDFHAEFGVERMRQYKETLEGLPAQKAAQFLLERHQGFVLGEGHKDTGSKAFLEKTMRALKEMGVETLFIEHVREEYQDLLDDWHRKRQQREAPEQLARMASKVGGDFGLPRDVTNVLTVLRAAHEAGIRVVGIDSLAALYEDSDERGRELRAFVMNVFGESVIRRQSGRGKFVILTGTAHATAHSGKSRFKVDALPGFAEMLKIPATTYDETADQLVLDVGQLRAKKND